MNIKCIFGHKYGEWLYVHPIGRYSHKLKRICKKCGKIEYYEGLTEVCIETGKSSPYIMKN